MSNVESENDMKTSKKTVVRKMSGAAARTNSTINMATSGNVDEIYESNGVDTSPITASVKKGGGRRSSNKQKMVNVALTISPDLVPVMDELSDVFRISRSELLRRAIERELAYLTEYELPRFKEAADARNELAEKFKDTKPII